MTQTNLQLANRNVLQSKAGRCHKKLGGKCYHTVPEHEIRQNNLKQERLIGNVTVVQ